MGLDNCSCFISHDLLRAVDIILFRFMTVEGTSKNRIISPGKVLHFYNSPPDSTVDSLNEVFSKVGVPAPNGIKFFSQGKDDVGCCLLGGRNCMSPHLALSDSSVSG